MNTLDANTLSIALNLTTLVVFLGGAAVTFRKLSGKPERREITNDPLGVRHVPDCATRPELDALERRMTSTVQDLRADLARVDEQGRDDVKRLHERLDDLPGKFMALLKNSGAID